MTMLCRSNLKGDLLNWDNSTWDLTNMVSEEVEMDSLCSPPRDLILFPRPMPFWRALELTQKMGAVMLPTPEDLNEKRRWMDVTKKLNDGSTSRTRTTLGFCCCVFSFTYYHNNHMITGQHFWTRWTDEKEEGQFLDAWTGESMSAVDEDRWADGEPNGEDVENCVEEYWMAPRNRWIVNDASCDERHWFLFRFERPPRYRLRGKYLYLLGAISTK